MSQDLEIVVTSVEEVQRRAGYQALQPVERPSWWGVDLDLTRRPGVPMTGLSPKPFPNTRFPPERQEGTSAVPKHGRPNRSMPPVFSTQTPLRGISGAIRAFAYRFPDHYPRHWLLLMLGDRVESWGVRARRSLPLGLALGALALVRARAKLRRRPGFIQGLWSSGR